MLAHQRQRLLERVEHAEAEQVDLDDAEVRAVVLVPLHDAAAGHRGRLDRHHLVEAARRDHDAARVLAQVARQTLHARRELEQARDARGRGVDARLAQRVADLLEIVAVLEAGDQLREAVERVRLHAQHLAHLAHGQPALPGDHHGRHRGARLAVLREHVLDHPLALGARRQIEIDVGPLAALLREEALEEQTHGDGIDRGDAERVTHGAVGRRAAPLRQDPLLLREARDVVDDQEVAGESQLLDHAQLVLELAARARGHGIAIALARAVLGEPAQPAHLRLAARHRELGEAVAEIRQAEGAALGDLARGAQPGRTVREARGGCGGRVQVALGVAREPAAGAVERGLRAQAGERVEEGAIRGGGEAHVARRDDRDARCFGQRHGAPRDRLGAALQMP